MIHRGQVLSNYIVRNRINKTKLANKLPWTVKTISRHVETADLSLERLLMYSEALGHDFSDEIPEMAALKFHLKEPAAPYEMSTKGNISEADYYKDKYFKLLEKYNEMLEQYNQSLQKNTR